MSWRNNFARNLCVKKMKNCKWLHYLSHYITDGINLVRTLRIYLSVLVCFKLCFSELSPFSSNDVIWMGFFLMTGEERESGCDRLTEGGFFVCLGGEDTWGIKDVRRSSTLMLKKKNNKVTNESLFCSSCLFCSGSKKKNLSGQTWNTYMSEKVRMVLETVY